MLEAILYVHMVCNCWLCLTLDQIFACSGRSKWLFDRLVLSNSSFSIRLRRKDNKEAKAEICRECRREANEEGDEAAVPTGEGLEVTTENGEVGSNLPM
jgi:hypothetical protein